MYETQAIYPKHLMQIHRLHVHICESRTMCVSHEVCIWVTNYAYKSQSRSVYVSHEQSVYVSHEQCIRNTLCRFTACMCVYASHKLRVRVTNYVFESQTKYMSHGQCMGVTNYACESRNIYMRHKLCSWLTVPHWAYESRTMYMTHEQSIQTTLCRFAACTCGSRIMCVSHELCICVMNYVSETPCADSRPVYVCKQVINWICRSQTLYPKHFVQLTPRIPKISMGWLWLVGSIKL